MKTFLKKFINKVLSKANCKVVYRQKGSISGLDMSNDLSLLINTDNPTCFDIGANKGQSTKMLQSIFKNPRIYSFEPSPDLFLELKSKNFGKMVDIFNFALGDEISEKTFTSYDNSELNSFLKIDQDFYNNIQEKSIHTVEIKTLDYFVEEHNIQNIDLVKIDTQGYEMNVLMGAKQCFKNKLIKNVIVEINFVNKYKNQSDFNNINNFLSTYNLNLVDFYQKSRINDTLSWCNGIYHLTA